MLIKFVLVLFSLTIGVISATGQVNTIYVRENDFVILDCEQYDRPQIPLWKGPKNYTTYAVGTRINTSLQKRDRLKMIRKASQINLQISNFSKEDQGDYKCIQTNQNGNISRKYFKVILQRDPSDLTIQNEQQNNLIFGYVNKTLTLNCTALDGIPPGRIQWQSNNVSFAISTHGCASFTFKPKLSDQQKNFTCTAKNAYTLMPLGRTVQLFLYEPPHVEIDQGQELNVTEGNSVQLDCLFSSNHQISYISWRYFVAENNSIILKSNNSVLRYDEINRNQSGKYECMIKNKAGSAGKDILVTVQYAPDVRVKYDDLPSLGRHIKCIPNGVPDSYLFYDWEHKSEYNEHIRYITDDRAGTLNIPTIKGETDRHHDRGIYVCSVSNGIQFNGSSIMSREFNLNASGKPYFVSSNKNNQLVNDPHSSDLYVLVISIPHIANVTMLNKNFIPIDAEFEFEKSVQTNDKVYGKNITVLATNVSLRLQLKPWEGVRQYSVAASNRYGTSSFTINVRLIRLPEMPSEIRTLARQTEILIYWKPGYNGGYKQFFVVRYRKTNDDMWHIHQAGTGNSTLIKDLIPNTEYYILLFARNKIGSSKLTEQYPIKTADVSHVPVKSFSEGTVWILITAIIILSVAFISVCIVKGLKSVMQQKKSNQSEESAEQNEADDYGDEYEEIESTLYIQVENHANQRDDSETHIMFHSDNIVFEQESLAHKSESQLCINEMINSLSDLDSDKSVESSDISYLIPSEPYTELKYLSNSFQSLHEYERVRIRRKCLRENLSDVSSDTKLSPKRSTI